MAFTSDLSGQEFWLVVDKGYIPMGLVLGNSVYSMGAMGGWLSGIKGQFRGEVVEVTRLMYDAREMALQRMKAEADSLGADGVIGVELKIEYLHGGQWMEVTAIGTDRLYLNLLTLVSCTLREFVLLQSLDNAINIDTFVSKDLLLGSRL